MTSTARALARAALGATTVVATLLAWTGGVASAQPTEPTQPAEPVRIMPLGDSITDGFNVPGGYRIDLWQKLAEGGYTIDFVGSQTNGPATLPDRNHQGHSGWRIDQIDANITTWLQNTPADTILLHIGTNDMMNASGAPARLSALLDKITTSAPEAHVFVATLVPLSFNDAAVRGFNAAIPAIVQSKVDAGRNVHLVEEMYGALTMGDLADGVHPNATGYSKMATVWYDALLSVPEALGGTGEPADVAAAGAALSSPGA